MTRAFLQGADFREASLYYADLRLANMRNVNLKRTSYGELICGGANAGSQPTGHPLVDDRKRRRNQKPSGGEMILPSRAI